jgi:uncharacterized protein (TIGR03435 family)
MPHRDQITTRSSERHRGGAVVIAMAALALSASNAAAQGKARSSVAPTYEVSSVKINESAEPAASGLGFQRGRFLARNVTLLQIIRAISGPEFLGADRIVGGPKWIDATRYDVEAVTDERLSQDERRAAVRAMLAERFRLEMHIEKQERPTYELTMVSADGRPSAQMRASSAVCPELGTPPPPPPPRTGGPVPAGRPPAAPPGPRAAGDSSPRAGRVLCGLQFAPGFIVGDAAAMWQLTTALGRILEVGRIVTDNTGVKARIDFTLRWEPMGPVSDATTVGGSAGAASQGPSIFVALEEQLGLRLRPAKAMLDVIVIDHAEPPTAN